MIGEKYWTTGITLTPLGDDRWQASLEFFDDGWCEPVSTQGTLRSRYYDRPETVIDALIADADRLGIVWYMRNLYVPGDSEDSDVPLPDGWLVVLKAQAERIGFECGYYEAVPEQAETNK